MTSSAKGEGQTAGIPEGPTLDQKVQALLAEFNALRTEIQYRSQFQHGFLQLHITLFGLILGAILTGLAQAQSSGISSGTIAQLSKLVGPWLVLLLPIESSVLGLWYVDHALRIVSLSAYIQQSIEWRVARLLKDPSIMTWESWHRERTFIEPVRQDVSWRIDVITFGGPGLVSWLIAVTLLVGSVPPIGYLLGLPPVYSPSQFVWALLLVALGGTSLGAYLVSVRYWKRMEAQRAAEVKKLRGGSPLF